MSSQMKTARNQYDSLREKILQRKTVLPVVYSSVYFRHQTMTEVMKKKINICVLTFYLNNGYQNIFQLELSAFEVSKEQWDQIVSVITLHNFGIIFGKSHSSL